jgi:hypothetical protein
MNKQPGVGFFEIVMVIGIMVLMSTMVILYSRAVEDSAHNRTIYLKSIAFLNDEPASEENKLNSIAGKYSIDAKSADNINSVTIGKLSQGNCIDIFAPASKQDIAISINGDPAHRMADMILCKDMENNRITLSRNTAKIELSTGSQATFTGNELTKDSF